MIYKKSPRHPLDIVYCVVYNTHMMKHFGDYIRQQREKLRENNPEFSLRKIAAKIGVEPSFLSKVERGEQPPPSEAKIALLAEALGEDADVLLALAGKVSSDLQKVIRQRPKLFAELIREMKDMPDHAMLRLVREVRDGKW
jgi:HTH-type transcriptional regulator, competence development regulator